MRNPKYHIYLGSPEKVNLPDSCRLTTLDRTTGNRQKTNFPK